MKRKTDKSRNEKEHFKKRAMQRFGLAINRHTIDEIVSKITSNRARFIEHQSHRVSVFAVEVSGQELIVCYDRNRHVPITVLPKGE